MTLNDLLNHISDLTKMNIALLRILLAACILLIGFILRRVFAKYIINILLRLTQKTKTDMIEILIHGFEQPVRTLISGFSIWLALSIFTVPPAIRTFLNLCLRLFFVIIIYWFLYRASDSIIHLLERTLNKTDKKSSPSLISLFSKLLKFFIILMEIFTIINILGFGDDISGIIAGFGLGGLAISLAAKDAAANFLGSITIMIDKTYSVGEWIATEKVEGTVEEIGFRSTKIRTFSDSLVSIPNSIMSNEPVTNWSKMGKRRVNITFQIPMDTPHEKIEMMLEKIRAMLQENEDINQDMIVVNLQGFKNATLEVLMYFFTKTTTWVSYLKVTEAISLKVLHIFEELQIPITLPAQRMIIESRENIIKSSAKA